MKKMTKQELMDWVADNYGVEENIEGDPKETLMAGWVNAMDMGNISDETFVHIAYEHFYNMGYQTV